MTYPVASTPTIFVDHQSLLQMVARVSEPGTKAILLGFGEYAKHLINLHPDNIAGVHDPRDWIAGILYKGIGVEGLDQRFAGNLLVVCEYMHVYEYLGMAVEAYRSLPYFIPSIIDGKRTEEIDAFSQEFFYQKLLAQHDEVPVSMMSIEKVKFLVELLRFGLTFDGDVVEMGSWQG